MKYVTLLKANIKAQKGSFIGIGALMFIITISLLAVLTIWKNATDYEEEQLAYIGYGDITCWLTWGADVKELTRQILEIEDVDKVEEQKAIYIGKYYVNGHEGVNGMAQLFTYGEEGYDFHIYNQSITGIEEDPEGLSEGEVYVSPAFCSLYDAQIGDEFLVEIAGEEDTASYTIKGFFEDPSAGSSMMGIKTILINRIDAQKLKERVEEAGQWDKAMNASLLHIFRTKDSTLPLGKLQTQLGEHTDLTGYMEFCYSKVSIMGFMLVLQNIFAGFLLVFVVVLLVITMVVIGHSISSSIEQDYVNMGILKAVGFTQGNLMWTQSMQYVLAVLCGMIPGALLSGMLIRLINRLTVTATGMIMPSDLDLPICGAAMGIILILLLGFIVAKTAGIGKITPIRAIRGGAPDVYFKSRFTTRIYQKGLAFHLALRALVSGKKQYISAGAVAALLVFFISLTVRIGSWIGPDGKGLMNSFAAGDYDIGFGCEDKELEKEIQETINRKAKVIVSYEFKMERATINGFECPMNIMSKPEYFNIVEGRNCKYENELLVTDVIAQAIEVGIGDTVLVSYKGRDKEFIITGIYQCANDMGENFGISKEGWEGFESEPVSFYHHYVLEDPSQTKELVALLKEEYGDRADIDENTWSGLESILTAMQALEIFMYVITAIFILVAVYLTGSKILYKEQHDMGIYKSLGFTAGKLRTCFALRFFVVAVAGSVLGNILSGLLTDPLTGTMLKMFGISSFESTLSLFYMIFSGAVVSGLFLAFSYIAAGKIKKVEPEILIVE